MEEKVDLRRSKENRLSSLVPGGTNQHHAQQVRVEGGPGSDKDDFPVHDTESWTLSTWPDSLLAVNPAEFLSVC